MARILSPINTFGTLELVCVQALAEIFNFMLPIRSITVLLFTWFGGIYNNLLWALLRLG